METRKRVWIAALCLLSATFLISGFRHHITDVRAATLPPHAISMSSAALAPHMTNAGLRAAAVRNAILQEDTDTTRVTGVKQPGRIVLPPVEQFTLTPPNAAQRINKTTLAVRFGTGVEKLPAQFPMVLGTQHVIVQRSDEAPDTYVTKVNFDWQAFAKEQAQRKEAASHGKMVPIFHGRRFTRTEPMQFMDPARIEGALQSQQPLQISPDMLRGGPLNLPNDHTLMITSLPVITDPARTFDPCDPNNGTKSGAWTFNILMQAIACSTGSGNCTQGAAENMLLSMLSQWQTPQIVNSFYVPARNTCTGPNHNSSCIGSLGGTGLLANWPIDQTNSCTLPGGDSSPCPSLPDAPVHLLAIVNRIDLGQNFPPFNTPNPPGGELRFVFSVTADSTPGDGSCHAGGSPFTIIVEYNVPRMFSATSWASQWQMLQDPTGNFGTTYRNDLQTEITDPVVGVSKCTSNNPRPVSCLAHIRTNEIEISNNGLWELRQFGLATNASGHPVLNMQAVSMTPHNSFNFSPGHPNCRSVGSGIHACNPGLFMKSWIDNKTTEIEATDGALPVVTSSVTNNNNPPQTDPFLGGSAFNDGTAFWVDMQQTNSEQARSDFSLNTCNGCHGGETGTVLEHINPRGPGGTSVLSNFLLGCATDHAGSCGSTAGDCSANGPCTINNPGTIQVMDPNPGQSLANNFGDILRRQTYIDSLINAGPASGGMLLPFLAQPAGVH